MAKRLFVGGLPYETTDSQLAEHFSQIGKVSQATVITDKFTGQGKGFGFVEFENDEDADKAIKTLSDTKLGERNIVVNEARAREERPQRDFGGGRRDGGGGGYRGARRRSW